MTLSPNSAGLQRMTLPFSGATALVKNYDSMLELPRHSHEYAVMVLVLRGDFVECCALGEQARTPGALRIFGSGEPHSNRYGSNGAKCMLIELPRPTLAVLEQREITIARSAHFSANTWEAGLARHMAEELRSAATAADAAVDSLLLELLVARNRHERRRHAPTMPRWLALVRERLHEQFARNISLLELAGAADVHPVTLARAFRRAFGQSPRVYVERLRLEHARRALAETDAPIAQIAVDAGFYDQPHLTRCFRRAFGCPPASYRADSRANLLA